MKLEKKKALAARTLNVGMNKIIFNSERLADIKEAITKQDVRDLQNSGAIFLKEKKGTLKKAEKKTRRRSGSVKRPVSTRKRQYMNLTRKLRTHIFSLRKRNKVSPGEYLKIRKEIRAGSFKSLANMKERISRQEAA